jgi:hypothetical protein
MYAPGGGLVSSTGRVGQIQELQFDLWSRTYRAENKNITIAPQRWAEWWIKVQDRAAQYGGEPLLVIDPANPTLRGQVVHIMRPERHAQLLEAERRLAQLEHAEGR